jgi:hypothetical protein
MAEFKDIGTRTGTDKIYNHGYHRFYPLFLEKYRNVDGFKMLEIGLYKGQSLALWKEYFPRGFIYTADICIPEYIPAEGDRYKVFLADQSSLTDLEKVKNGIGEKIPFIIDDGSHNPEHQLISFNYLFESLLSDGGCYIIEDIETSYWVHHKFDGIKYGYKSDNSIQEIFKTLVDNVNDKYLSPQNKELQNSLVTKINNGIKSRIATITFGRNCIIITKKTSEDDRYDAAQYGFASVL